MKGQKKPTKAKQVKKLFNRCSALWKEFCFLRDGRECQVEKFLGRNIMPHSTVFQVDHFVSRQNKNTFFDTSNGTVVCSSCNWSKNMKNKAIDFAINEIVKHREGESIYLQLIEEDRPRKPNLGWGKIWWLESQYLILTELVHELKKHKDVL